MNKNKVRYYRLASGKLEIQVEEGRGWVNYRRSKLYEVDSKDYYTEGYATFLNCLDHKYEVVKTEVQYHCFK